MPRVYRLDLDEARIAGARFALLPGDPFRSRTIAERIGELYGGRVTAHPLAHKREYCTYLSEVAGTKVLVTSTGIGGPSTAIAVDELAQLGVDTFIRVGTTGAIQDAMAIGPRGAWTKPGVAAPVQRHDEYECEREAVLRRGTAAEAAAVFAACMRARGYAPVAG